MRKGKQAGERLNNAPKVATPSLERQQWLEHAVHALRARFAEAGYTVPEKIRVSIGWPKRAASCGAIGECWSPSTSSDKHAELFISPQLTEGAQILHVLAHEMDHATVGTEGPAERPTTTKSELNNRLREQDTQYRRPTRDDACRLKPQIADDTTRVRIGNCDQANRSRKMVFDILGKAPRSKVGRIFQVNNSGWYDMADACHRVSPNICAKIDKVYWYSNDGYGLDDADAVRLADALDAAIERGALGYADAMSGQESAAERKRWLGLKLPDGRSLALAAPDLLPKGKPWLIDRLREFAAFLRARGGFSLR